MTIYFFLKKLLFFIIPIILVSLLLDFVVTSGLKKSQNYDFREWNDLYQGKINSDLIINGSSRAWVHISPQIIDTKLSLNSYNLGIDGHNFYMQYCRFLEYCHYNKPPKYIIQSVDLFTLFKRKDLYNKTQFLPYFDKKNIRKYTKSYLGFSNSDYYLPFYRYLNNFEIIKIGFLNFFKYEQSNNGKIKGYLGIDKKWDDSYFNYLISKKFINSYEFDDLTLFIFDQYLNFCTNNNIKVILVYTPEFIGNQMLFSNRLQVIERFKKISKNHDIIFLDYSLDSMSFKMKYFYNSQHLNKYGSEIFSKKLCDDLNKLKFIN
jgi:hypothetical protein